MLLGRWIGAMYAMVQVKIECEEKMDIREEEQEIRRPSQTP